MQHRISPRPMYRLKHAGAALKHTLHIQSKHTVRYQSEEQRLGPKDHSIHLQLTLATAQLCCEDHILEAQGDGGRHSESRCGKPAFPLSLPACQRTLTSLPKTVSTQTTSILPCISREPSNETNLCSAPPESDT